MVNIKASRDLEGVREQLEILVAAADDSEVCFGFLMTHAELLCQLIGSAMFDMHNGRGCPLFGSARCTQNRHCIEHIADRKRREIEGSELSRDL